MNFKYGEDLNGIDRDREQGYALIETQCNHKLIYTMEKCSIVGIFGKWDEMRGQTTQIENHIENNRHVYSFEMRGEISERIEEL